MKTARLFFAVLSLATLAACGTDSITAPDAARQGRTPAPPTATTSNDVGLPVMPPEASTGIITDPSGVTVETCVTTGRGPLAGSGN